MTVHTCDTPVIGEAQARGGVYALLASAWRYPDEVNVPLLTDMTRRLSGDPDVLSPLDADTREALGQLAECLLAEGDVHRLEEDMRTCYAALFGHAVRGA